MLLAVACALILSGCSLEGSVEYLNGGPKGAGLLGKALMFGNTSQSQSLSNVSLSTCTDKKVTIHAVKTDGSIDTSSLGESKISSDGSFEIPNSSQYPLGTSVSYVLMASGCGENFYRPVTDYTDQDISMGTTFLGFLPEVNEAGKKELNHLTLSQMSSVLTRLTSVNESNLSDSFDAIAQDASSKAAFESLTGISIESLKEIPPTTVAISLPSTIKEGQSNSLSVTAQHWYAGYQKAHQWVVDGTTSSTSASLSWSLGKNSQGAHTVTLYVGSDNGSGHIDLAKPVYQKSMSLNVQDTYPATPPAILMVSLTNSTSLTVAVSTGAALVNCETFSSMAITEGFLPPSSSDFTRTCTTAGTQNETFTLSNTETTRQVSLWVKDASGHISLTYSGQFVTLDQTLPTVTLNNFSGTQVAGTNVNVHWSAADLSGLASLTLKYAADGVTFSDVVDLLATSATSPYAWTVATDHVTTARLRLVATDNAGNSNSVTTNAFIIDATAPGPPEATLGGNPTLTNGAFDITVSFTEAITGLTAGDFTVTNGSASNLVSVSAGSYTLTITPSIASGATGTTTIMLPAGTVEDLASVANIANSNILTVNIDKIKPTVTTLTSTSPDPTNTDVSVTVTFSENVTGFTSTDLSVTNGSVSSISGSGQNYTVIIASTIAAQSSGTMTVSIPAGGVTDAAGNTNEASPTPFTINIDKVGPTVALTSASANPTNTTFAVTADLGKASSNFAVGDITVSGGTATNFAVVNASKYTFNVVPSAQGTSPGTVSVSVAAGTLTDSALGNPNTASNTLSRTVTEISQTWSTTLTSSDNAIFPVAGGVASLTGTNLTQTDFSTGTHNGTTYDATNGNRLTLDKTLPSPKELDSSWAPKWSNIVGYWSLNGSGTIAANSTISHVVGVDGTLVNASAAYTAGKLSQALSFDGTNYIDFGSNVYGGLSQVTVSAWIKPSSFATTQTIVGKETSFKIQLTTAAKPVFFVSTNGSSWACSPTASAIPLSVWSHVAGVYSGAAAAIYVNGEFAASCGTSGTLADNTRLFRVSGINSALSEVFSGDVDEVTIWNTNLSANEVKYIYQKQNPNSAQAELDSSWTPHWNNLVGYWNMNGSGTIADVATINASVGSNGTASNANGSGMTYSTSQLFQGVYFDGTDDYLTVSHSANQNSYPLSISFWIRTSANWTQSVIEKYVSGSSNGWSVWTTGNGNICASYFKNSSNRVRDATNCGNSTTFKTNAINDGNWHMVSIVIDSSGGSLYRDGILESTLAWTGTPNAASGTSSINIGRYNGSSNAFQGTLDEIGVWSAALSSSEIVQIYTKQKTKYGGVYKSPVQSISTNSSWSSTKWISTLPFYKELPGDTNADGTSDSESSAEYSGVSANLANNLEGLWHLDESSWNGTTNEVVDSSGKGRHGTAQNSANVASGILKNGANLVYASQQHIRTGNFNMGTVHGVTWSAWIKNNNAQVTTKQGIAFKATATMEVFLYSTGQLYLYIANNTAWHLSLTSPIYTDWNSWHHVVATYDGSFTYLYRDGKLVAQSTAGVEAGDVADNSQIAKFGQSSGATNIFDGYIDEIALWSRGLTANEVLQLYRRGANRNKFQFRTCTQSDCSDKTDADWVGPDKTASSWFSELHNMTAVASTGDGSGSINLTSPLIDFSKWIAAVSGWTFNPTPARYFQYRALMESDDVNNLCLDSSNNAIPCMPDITSVTPTAELSPAPYITSATGISFYTTLSSLDFTTSGTCTSDSNYPAKFQLSKDGGSTYQYYNGTSWASATAGTYSQASTLSQINIGLSSDRKSVV